MGYAHFGAAGAKFAASGNVGMHLGTAKIFGGYHLPGGHLHQRRTAEKRIGHFINHDRLTGHEHDICAARGITAGGKRNLFQPIKRLIE